MVTSGAIRRFFRSRASSVSRRDFLRVGSLSAVGLTVADRRLAAAATDKQRQKSCILILMTGGPSQLDTFDPKPLAPSHIRGPLRSISTAIPGVAFNESLPQLAKRANRFAVVRTLTHDYAPIHETGMQLLQTGRVAQGSARHPSFGSLTAKSFGNRGDAPAYVVLPRLVGDTGVETSQGQDAGSLGAEFEPYVMDADADTAWLSARTEAFDVEYGNSNIGRMCLRACQLVEAGVRCVTVNMFDSLNHNVTWDCHARTPWSPATLFDYRDTLCPQFDRAMSALLDDLEQRGLLDDTLVVATGEFGRTPYLNEHGGRDHWPRVWSGLIAGGGVEGGRIIGSSDRIGGEPLSRPVPLMELTATIHETIGLKSHSESDESSVLASPALNAAPIRELFA